MQGKIKVHIWKTCLSPTSVTVKPALHFLAFCSWLKRNPVKKRFFCTFGWRFKVLPITKHIFRLQIDNVLNRPIQPCTTLTLYYTAVTGQHLQTHERVVVEQKTAAFIINLCKTVSTLQTNSQPAISTPPCAHQPTLNVEVQRTVHDAYWIPVNCLAFLM